MSRVTRVALSVWLILLLVALFLGPLIWLLLAKRAGFTFATASQPADPLVFVTSIATIMGSIFVAGGLIIALASLVTLVDIDRRVQRQIKSQIGIVLPQIQESADRQIQAHILVTKAETSEPPWQGPWRKTDGYA